MISMFRQNGRPAKLKRTLTSFLPVAKERHGQCKRCGACCKLPKTCPFLRANGNGESTCGIYFLRPLACRKYPRTAGELLTAESCGYSFNGDGKSAQTARV